jgi:hypothetical protein
VRTAERLVPAGLVLGEGPIALDDDWLSWSADGQTMFFIDRWKALGCIVGRRCTAGLPTTAVSSDIFSRRPR